MARIEMFRENYKEAYLLADEIIRSEKFRFIKQDEIIETDIYGKELKVDRIFMPEMIFGLYTETILAASKKTYEGLTQDFVKSDACYEESDIRRNWLYTNPSANNKINLIRYQRSKLTEDASKYGPSVAPMLKLSEMYLIAAECAGSKKEALEYFNTLRQHRGFEVTDDLKEEDTTDEKLQTAIGKEYRKEFIGEGQWFFYCKRTDQATLPNVQVPFSKAYYVLPIPDQELEYGNRN